MAFANIVGQSRIAEKLQKLRGGFNDRPTDPADLTGVFLTILIPIAFVLLILLVRNLRSRYKKGHAAPARPMRLFDMVLKKMGASFTDRFLFRAFARSTHLNHPTVILFSREIFERHASRWIDKLTVKAIRSHAQIRLAALEELAFGPKPEAPPSKSLVELSPFEPAAESPPAPESTDAEFDATMMESEEPEQQPELAHAD